jgi:hypothetical protein
MRNSQERNNRLENLCWRIWNVARKKKQVRHGTHASFNLPGPQGTPAAGMGIFRFFNSFMFCTVELRLDHASNKNAFFVLVVSKQD